MKIRSLAFLPALLLSSACFATTCSVNVDSTDLMQFDKKSIVVPASCKNFTVNLKHSGKLNRSVMGHNWVLTEAADMKSVVADGVTAGLASGYVKPGDSRVIAATKLIGGGESDSVTFDSSKLQAGNEYSYFCSFPGHASMMAGKLTFAK